MASVFRRRPVSCFYCQSLIYPAPRNPRYFLCRDCTCWNRYDAKGEIMSDEPAMHDESMNSSSYSKHASANKTRLPSAYSRGNFCHTCRTNQTLVVNLLSHYLPPLEDPTYKQRLASLPAYKHSLEARYPLICRDCLPSVEEELSRRDNFARTEALGWVLKDSKGKDTSKRSVEQKRLVSELFVWKIRGALWFVGLLVSIFGYLVGALELRLLPPAHVIAPILPAVALISIMWTFWDPTHPLAEKSKQQRSHEICISGRSGRRSYIKFQFLLWSMRMTTSLVMFHSWMRSSWEVGPSIYYNLTPPSNINVWTFWFRSCLCVELSVLICCYRSIQIRRPPSVRLIDTHEQSKVITNVAAHGDKNPIDDTCRQPTPALSSSVSSVTSTAPDPDLFATLSLSQSPIISNIAHGPVFGRPSLRTSDRISPSATQLASFNDDHDPDAMDWEPSNALPLTNKTRSRWGGEQLKDDVWLRPQQFFPPEEPTGLESLLMHTRLMDDEQNNNGAGQRHPRNGYKCNWYWVSGFSCLIAGCAAWLLWGTIR